MRIGIIGNYGHNNNGDEAILSGLLHQLMAEGGIKKENIVVFSNNPSNTTARHGVAAYPLLYKKGNIIFSGLTTVLKSRKIMKQLDLLIVGGGGLLMDMYKRDAPLYSVLGLTGNYSGCRVAVHGVGAGPIQTRLGKFFIKKLISVASSVTVRDEKSKELLKHIGVKRDVHVIFDPAFSVPVTHSHQPSKKIEKVGVTAVPYFSQAYWPVPDKRKYQDYIEGMALSLDQLIQEKGVRVTFFSTKYPEDVQVTRDIFKLMETKEQVEIIEDNLMPEEIVNIAGSQDLVIGTRLHSLILAVNAATPVIGVEYHKKVKDFMGVIKKEQYSVAIDQITDPSKGIAAVFERASENWDALQTDTADDSKRLKETASEGIELLNL
ncbi:polysaccharide pyruvyl transferase family protein [Alteribacillus iranensis]|uniref:Polysaccharide pyruvyl transferase CsaB n=1 Tax=Alteribacillus iranensis TaxID=930128 RepID=A0A1I2EH44_9BACI|nr:polysaccharide pyruvyl transferase family protein [Alteribacillus iranensis]SFE92282.1 polysaccharide pyruvyl transferase CsaB [Alteribacillus iranensis]